VSGTNARARAAAGQIHQHEPPDDRVELPEDPIERLHIAFDEPHVAQRGLVGPFIAARTSAHREPHTVDSRPVAPPEGIFAPRSDQAVRPARRPLSKVVVGMAFKTYASTRARFPFMTSPSRGSTSATEGSRW
jgi:hypothetical protein